MALKERAITMDKNLCSINININFTLEGDTEIISDNASYIKFTNNIIKALNNIEGITDFYIDEDSFECRS